MADIRITPASSSMAFTSSLNFKETLTQDPSGSLVLQGSGSTGRTNLFAVDGNNGRLFSIDDDLSNSLFSVNTIAGLPVIEAFADNTVVMGQYGQNVLVVTGSSVGVGTATPNSKLQVVGNTSITGSLNVSAGITGSLQGTASSAGSVSGLTLTNSGTPADPDTVTQNQIGYNNNVSLFSQTDGGLYSSAYSSAWIHQIFGDFRTGQIAIRGKNSGTWQSWRTVLDSTNFSTYAATAAQGTNATTAFGWGNHASAGYYLASNPSGYTTNTGTVTGVGTAGTVNGITLTGGTITGTGTITLGGTLSGIGNAQLTNSNITVGSTAISLGSSATTIAGLSSVTSTTFVGALTGNATTATTADTASTVRITNDAGTAGLLPVLFAPNSGSQGVRSDVGKFSYIPIGDQLAVVNISSSGEIRAGTFTGSLQGTASYATYASQSGYTMQFVLATTGSNLAASTTYRMGAPVRNQLTSATGRNRIYVPRPGKVKYAHVYVRTNGTLASAGTSTLALNKNSAVTETIGTSSVIGLVADAAISSSAVSMSVVQADYLEITFTTPAWGTLPTAVEANAIIYIENNI